MYDKKDNFKDVKRPTKWSSVKNHENNEVVSHSSIPDKAITILINTNKKLLEHYITLITNVNRDKDFTWISRKTIRDFIHKDKFSGKDKKNYTPGVKAVSNAIKELERLKLIKIHDRGDKSNVYLVRNIWNWNDPIWGDAELEETYKKY